MRSSPDPIPLTDGALVSWGGRTFRIAGDIPAQQAIQNPIPGSRLLVLEPEAIPAEARS